MSAADDSCKQQRLFSHNPWALPHFTAQTTTSASPAEPFSAAAQYRPNITTPIFDVRRPAIKAGSLCYHGSLCKEVPPAVREGSHASHYYSCAAGADCSSAHSLVESLYNPGAAN